jgi:hypothetical protein
LQPSNFPTFPLSSSHSSFPFSSIYFLLFSSFFMSPIQFLNILLDCVRLRSTVI